MSEEHQETVIVIGAGIAGLTAGALLAHQGKAVKIFEQAAVVGGCASTFKRRDFTFDVGATQVAGFEPGGIHWRIFRELGIELPSSSPCDPACAVFLPGESEPIQVWRDPVQWQAERERQFPGSESFWQLLSKLFRASWQFQARDPVLPPRNLWDCWQLVSALRPDMLITVPFTLMTVADALKLFGLQDNRRLKTFLDLQLKLYSQVGADETALLYAATALAVSQEPQGLSHLHGSMQVLSDRLVQALEQGGGKLYRRHIVEKINTESNQITSITIKDLKTGKTWQERADCIVANVTAQNLVSLVDSQSPRFRSYHRRIEKFPDPSGAFVIYLGVDERAVPLNCPPHLQFFYDYEAPIAENYSLFVSVSQPGDGRAPAGKRTIIASSFTDSAIWQGTELDYQHRKQEYMQTAIARLGHYFDLSPEHICHQEAGTPRTFARYTARMKGYVGGLGQRISSFGPFGLATRTPFKNLWIVGDSTHPGEGTAGVSYSALTAVRQIQAQS